jgi:hypothetical protein
VAKTRRRPAKARPVRMTEAGRQLYDALIRLFYLAALDREQRRLWDHFYGPRRNASGIISMVPRRRKEPRRG